jgi:formylglycine-generating enzyme required for sulfatase activity
MRLIYTVLTASALIAVAPLSSRAPAQEASRRPDPVPAITGMVFVPAGDFLMGSTADEVRRASDADEYPQRKLWLDDYYIDMHEVTNAQYKVFVDSMKVPAPPKWVDGNYGIGEDGLPVVSITWEEAAAYAKFVGKRLPTEAEWEKAARGTDGRTYPWGNTFDRLHANNGDHLMPIMSYPSGVSPFGVFDMAGNAAEWVNGHYEAYPRTEPLPRDIPDRREIFKGDRRVYRGGSWNTFPKYLRCSNRESTSPGKRWVYIGFRCVMDPPWKKAAQ